MSCLMYSGAWKFQTQHSVETLPEHPPSGLCYFDRQCNRGFSHHPRTLIYRGVFAVVGENDERGNHNKKCNNYLSHLAPSRRRCQGPHPWIAILADAPSFVPTLRPRPSFWRPLSFAPHETYIEPHGTLDDVDFLRRCGPDPRLVVGIRLFCRPWLREG